MTDLIIVLVLIGIVGAAVLYVIKARKKGVKCIGCPNGCNGNCESGCANHTDAV